MTSISERERGEIEAANASGRPPVVSGVTEIMKAPGRGHSLTIDQGWCEIAQMALDFADRFAPVDSGRLRNASAA